VGPLLLKTTRVHTYALSPKPCLQRGETKEETVIRRGAVKEKDKKKKTTTKDVEKKRGPL